MILTWNFFNLNAHLTKFPYHILLDLNTHTSKTDYWFLKYIFSATKQKPHSYFLNFILKSRLKKNYSPFFENFITKNHKKFGLRFFENQSFFFHKNFFSINAKNPNFKKSVFLDSNEKFFYNSNFKSSKQNLKTNAVLLLKNLSRVSYLKSSDNTLWNLFDINFLRKEKIYTKLKYSRVPQYDIVSGGVAALFAGFLGFLICEKFGFELLDSGDFYILFMYVVFLCFFFKMILNIFTLKNTNWSVLSPKWFFSFYKNLTVVFFEFLSKLFKK